MANFKSITWRVINPLRHHISSLEPKPQPNSTMPGREATIIGPDDYKRDHVNSVPAGRYQI